MVRQHDATRPHADALRGGGDASDDDFRRARGDGGEAVVLGDPVAPVSEPIRVDREIDGIGERGGRRGRFGDEGQVENGQIGHEGVPAQFCLNLLVREHLAMYGAVPQGGPAQRVDRLSR